MLNANEKHKYLASKFRIRTALLAACVLSCGGALTASAQQVGLALSSGSGSPGGRVTLNVSLTDSGGAQPASLQWSMKYSTADITGVTVSTGSAASTAQKNILCNTTSGNTTCIVSGLDFGSISQGPVATATFQISAGTQSASVPIQMTNAFAASGDGSAIPASGTGGSISFATQTVLSGFSCSPSIVNTPGTAACTVSVGGAAPSTAFPVSLSSNNSSVTIPASVSIGAGSTSASFTAKVASVSNNATATLTASASGVSKTFSLSLVAAGSSTPPPPVSVSLSSLTCTPSTLSSGASSSCTAALTGATASTVSIGLKTSNSLIKVPSSVSIGAGSSSAKFTATAGTVTSNQSGTLTATYSGVSKTFTLNLASTISSQSATVFPSNSVPGTITDPDTNAVEIGMKFRSDVAGVITGIRFYKSPYNFGAHTGHLWTKAGSLLGTVTFTSESASGWQQANFTKPVSIQANTTYIVSYYAPGGHYSSNQYFFRSAVNSAPLHGLQDGTDGSNGVYRYGSSGFPNQSWNASNYWVDVVFSSATSSLSAGALLSAQSIWTPQTTPDIASTSDSQSVELGMKFRSDVGGTVTGIRFFKGSENTGTHTGHLWSSNGALLASVDFSHETSSGWQQASFAKPVAIQPNTTYVVSYFAPNGHYAANLHFFEKSADQGPLHALDDAQSGGNGLFTYGNSGFPNQTWNETNYWVDVLFVANVSGGIQ